MDRSHGGRVSHEVDVESAAANSLGDAMAEQGLASVFVSGRTIKETAAWNDHNGKNLMLRFDDGTSITFTGEFAVNATQGLLDGAVGDKAPSPDLIEAGRQLMSGDFDPEQEQHKLLDELES